MDHLAAIRTFLRVAELESFSEAARQLRLPKSLVTKRVNYLEQHLGTPLLARTTRRVRLTESGSLYHPRALALGEELEALPGGWRVAAVHRLEIPGLEAERHLVELARAPRQERRR